ncbi:MAG: hypothetical protein P4L70_05495 [Parasulfuritortus sp.]|jgi:tRNA G46 methylase TrmB|nr:hypothetical protein [Parasulfuritortus sp.]
MMTVTRDPITLNDVTDLSHAPFVLEGSGSGAMKIYFESEANKAEYLGTEMHGGVQSAALTRIFSEMAENPDTGSIN